MLDAVQRQLREDCHRSFDNLPGLASKLSGQRIAVVGGTGFVGSWLAEAVAALNDDFGASARIDLLSRGASLWREARPHLQRDDVTLHTVDVRSAFELPRDTTLVLFAAGVADPRIHASDPHRVFQTNVYGLDHALGATARLEKIQRFLNLSSGLVSGGDISSRGLTEADIGELDFTRFHNLYVEARRGAESLAGAYAGQYRIPVSTARAFTFLGPYQSLDAPWALNNFIRDALAGNDIRIHGGGQTRRSYLYGSDVAAWLLKALVDGCDGEVYNIGGDMPVTHAEAAACVASFTVPHPKLVYKSQPGASGRNHDFYPDATYTMRALGVRPAFDLQSAIERSMRWHAHALSLGRRVRAAV